MVVWRLHLIIPRASLSCIASWGWGLSKCHSSLTRVFIGATKDIVESAGGSRDSVFQTKYPYGTFFDVAFSVLGLSDGYAYTAAQDILDKGVGAGDTVDFVAHSGGGQRLAMASRILGDYDIYGNALASITGPVFGRFSNLNTIGLVGSPTGIEFTSELQYGLSWGAVASKPRPPLETYYDYNGGAIPHQTPIQDNQADLPYLDYLGRFLRNYGGYRAP